MKAIAAGREHSVFVTEKEGYCYTCGAGFGGRLGISEGGEEGEATEKAYCLLTCLTPSTRRFAPRVAEDVSYPTLCGISGTILQRSRYYRTHGHVPPNIDDAIAPYLLNIVQAAAGDLHTLALDGYGRVYSWGFNETGALGRTSTEKNHHVPEIVEFPYSDRVLSR